MVKVPSTSTSTSSSPMKAEDVTDALSTAEESAVTGHRTVFKLVATAIVVASVLAGWAYYEYDQETQAFEACYTRERQYWDDYARCDSDADCGPEQRCRVASFQLGGDPRRCIVECTSKKDCPQEAVCGNGKCQFLCGARENKNWSVTF